MFQNLLRLRLILAILHLAEPMRNASRETTGLIANAMETTPETPGLPAIQSVRQSMIVQMLPALTKNAEILVRERADKMLIVELSTTTQFVLVQRDTPEIRSPIVVFSCHLLVRH